MTWKPPDPPRVPIPRVQATRSFVNRISLVGHKATMGLEFLRFENPVG